MAMTLEQLEAEALKLSETERELLAHRLAPRRPDARVEAAWDAEIQRRVREIENGEVEPVPLEQVLRELRDDLAE